MSQREKKEQLLRDEMERCILLPPDEKKFWIENAAILPNAMLDEVFRIVQEKNETVDRYIEAALAEDKDRKYLSELKAKIKKMKTEAFAMEEKSEEESVEEILEQQLEDLSWPKNLADR